MAKTGKATEIKFTELGEETLRDLLLYRIKHGQYAGFIETKDWFFRNEIRPKTIEEQMRPIDQRTEE